MGQAIAALVVILTIWGALAQIMPDTFQITREKHKQLMSVVFGPKTVWLVVVFVGLLLGWYIWNLEGRLATLAGSTPSSTPAGGQQDDTGLVVTGWTADQSSCRADFDPSKVPDKIKNSFDAAIICGFVDPQTDPMKDTRVTVSRLFTIQNPLGIAAQFSSTMADSLQKEQDAAIQKMQPPAPHGTGISLTNVIWIKPVLLPKGFDTSNIHKVDDVVPNGGKVSDRMSAVNILKVVPAK
jgi:hypothetical protein